MLFILVYVQHNVFQVNCVLDKVKTRQKSAVPKTRKRKVILRREVRIPQQRLLSSADTWNPSFFHQSVNACLRMNICKCGFLATKSRRISTSWAVGWILSSICLSMPPHSLLFAKHSIWQRRPKSTWHVISLSSVLSLKLFFHLKCDF